MRYCAPCRGAASTEEVLGVRTGRRMVASAVTSRQPCVQLRTVSTAIPTNCPAKSSRALLTASMLGKSNPLTRARHRPLHSSVAQILSPRFTMLKKHKLTRILYFDASNLMRKASNSKRLGRKSNNFCNFATLTKIKWISDEKNIIIIMADDGCRGYGLWRNYRRVKNA